MLQRPSQGTMMIIVICTIAVLLVAALFYWFKPKTTANSSTAATIATAPLNKQPDVVSTLTPPQQAQPRPVTTQQVGSNSQHDIQVDCQLQLEGSGALVVNASVKDCYEFFISQYGEKTPAQVNQDFKHYIDQHYKTRAHDQILDLWKRYLDYRQALGQLQPPQTSDKNSPDYYRDAFIQLKNLRQHYFSALEITGLFGDEDTYQQYTLGRLAILDNKKLSESDKAAKLNDLLNTLPADLQNEIKQIQTLDNLHRLTDAIKARGGSAQELHQMRLNLVGADATTRLETLDQTRNNWKNQVNDYLSARDQITQSGISDSAKAQAITQLRQRYFPQASDALRVQTFETIHDQGGKLPFSN